MNDLDRILQLSGVLHQSKQHGSIRESAASSNSLLDQARRTDWRVRYVAMRNPNATPEILLIGARDKDHGVRAVAMQSPNATEEILMIGARDENWMVREYAMKNGNATKEILMIGARDESWWVREIAMKNPNATAEILSIGARDQDFRVREAAMENPNATGEIKKKAQRGSIRESEASSNPSRLAKLKAEREKARVDFHAASEARLAAAEAYAYDAYKYAALDRATAHANAKFARYIQANAAYEAVLTKNEYQGYPEGIESK